MRKITKFDKVALGAVAVIAITNPASGAVILDGLESIFKLIFQYGSPINFVATGVVLAYIGFKIWSGRDVTHVPTKAHKAPKQAYLEA